MANVDKDDIVDEDFIDESCMFSVNFSPDVQQAIDQVFPSSDSLDRPDFNAIDYINTLFPTEQSLANIDEVVKSIDLKIKHLDDDIKNVVRGQTNVGDCGRQSLQEAQGNITQLFSRIKDIKSKADKSEEMVKEITRDIKQLDLAKRNLTSSITALNHLHMLLSDVDQLDSLIKQRNYREISNILERVINVLEHFQNYMAIPQIKQLNDRVTQIKNELSQQIRHDFEEMFGSSSYRNGNVNQALLPDACSVIDVLDPNVRCDLLKWFVKTQLSEYTLLFAQDQEDAWLDKIDRRYGWIKKTLMDFEKNYAAVFPMKWEVSERICVEFCEITNRELSSIMSKRKNEIDVKLLLWAIGKTTNFEGLCNKKYNGLTLLPEKPEVAILSPLTPTNPFMEQTNPFENATSPDKPDKNFENSLPFTGLISRCFEDHLDIYVGAQDRNLSELINRFLEEFKQMGPPRIDGNESNVLSSCADLFVYYKQCMVQCSQLSTGQPMLQLTHTFQKYLREYAEKLLLNNLPKSSSTTSGLIQSIILNESDQMHKLTEEEQRLICSILCTAEYCTETTQQLADKLVEKVDVELKSQINLTVEQNFFHTVLANCIQLLVQDLEGSCEPALTAMSKLPWQNIESVGDQSNYVTNITSHLKLNLPIIRDNLATSRKYFTQFCIKFVKSFIQRFITAIYKCKPIGTVGAEQLLLDTHSLKTLLLDLPSLESQVPRKAPASFTKIVVKGMTKAEMILKVVMSHTEDSNKAFVDNYLNLLPDSDINEFTKVLDMKGIKRNDQLSLLDIYKARNPAGVSNISDISSGVSLNKSLSTPEPVTSGIKKLERFIKKF